jgi:acid stress-induced BolA-like protein IbaG/YrbA
MNLSVSVNLDLSGIRAVRQHLEDEIDKAILETCQRIERQAKINTPVDTGFLRNSIHSMTLKHGSPKTGELVRDAAKPVQRFVGVVSAPAEYAAFVEYGHFARRNTTRMSTRGLSKKGNPRLTAQRLSDRSYGTYVQGRFFLKRAVDANREFFQTRLRRAIRDARARS